MYLTIKMGATNLQPGLSGGQNFGAGWRLNTDHPLSDCGRLGALLPPGKDEMTDHLMDILMEWLN